MKGHRMNQEQSKVFHEIYKNDTMMANINENIEENKKNKDNLTTELSNAKSIDDIKSITNSIEDIDNKIKQMESRLKECMNNNEELNKTL